MRQDHAKRDWLWGKSEIITKCSNNSWSFEMENAFESAIFNSEKDKPLTWFLKQKDRLSSLNPEMSDSMINMKILRKCGGELENAIKCRCVEPCSSEYYIHRGKSRVNRRRLTSRQANIKQDKSRAHVKQKSSERQAHVTLWSYTKSCDIQ
ncbi:hypothetical protein O181_115206 [Austropuccinia psidii MF-1]|uniref:Uncharacterized protein n=1 Tax=Austropuccinia psidii MF-1 TaxID=1389203 RepID=A0A9Q3K7P2_9BASI|nr:hypothetical protein [Austropuccinia psidii MF-1]